MKLKKFLLVLALKGVKKKKERKKLPNASLSIIIIII